MQKETSNGCYDEIEYYYDKALANYLDLYEKNKRSLNEEDYRTIETFAGNHIGFFMTWIIRNHFEGEIHEEEDTALEAVRTEKMTGTEFLIQYCDGKFRREDVSDEIAPFVDSYYERYFSDYTSWVINELCDLPLEFAGTWEDYHQFEHILDDAYRKFSETR